MRLIDADALINDRETFIVIGAGDNICIDIADINKAPAVDAVPVVRCKDCKFLWKKNMLCVHPKRLQGMIAFCECEENDYCSYGERRTDGKTDRC